MTAATDRRLAGGRAVPNPEPAPPGPTRPEATEHLARCPVCDSESIRFAFWGKARHAPHWYRYARCADCALRFVNPRVPASVRDAEVEAVSYSATRFARKIPFDLPEFRANIVRPVARLHPPAGPDGARRKWLDAGCATGNLLAVAAEAGYEPHGVEPSPRMVAYVRELRPEIRISRGFVGDLPPDVRYDVVSADNVLEHVHDPAAFLAEIRARMAGPDSLLVVRVPNFDNALRIPLTLVGRLSRSWIVDPEAHPCNYAKRSLTALLVRTGFRPIRVERHAMLSYPLKHILAERAKSRDAGWTVRAEPYYRSAFLFDRIVPFGGIDVSIFARRD